MKPLNSRTPGLVRWMQFLTVLYVIPGLYVVWTIYSDAMNGVSGNLGELVLIPIIAFMGLVAGRHQRQSGSDYSFFYKH